MMMSFSLLDFFFRSVERFEREKKKKRFELEHDNAARNTSLLNTFQKHASSTEGCTLAKNKTC